VVFHAAGITKAADPKAYYLVNGEGTRAIAEATARDTGGRAKFVYVSSQAASGPSSEGVPRREEDPSSPVSDYGRSKLLGEERILALRDRLNVAIVRPTSVYGPRDRDIYTFFKLVSKGIRTSFKERRMVSLCYVDDLVEGILRAAFADTENGESFFMAHPEPCDWDYIGETMAWALGVRARRVVVPLPVLSLVALAAEGYAAITGRPALLNRQKMAEIRQRFWVVDVGRAARRLSFTAGHDFRHGASLTADWYRAQGWI
jgi:nucleoside-diphosphate-sugar epimerase